MGKYANKIRQMDKDGFGIEAIAAAVEMDEADDTPRAAHEFELWYRFYPHKVGKADAAKAFKAARRLADLDTLIEGVRRYVNAKRPDAPYCNPGTWLRQQRWLDQPATVAPQLRGFDQVKAELQQEFANGYGGEKGGDLQDVRELPRLGGQRH